MHDIFWNIMAPEKSGRNKPTGEILKVIEKEFGSFDAFIWRFVDGVPKQNNWRSLAEIPASTPQSDAMSKELKKRGFKFVGSTICYAFMQATGMVNDHTVDCYRHLEIRKENDPR